MSFYGVEYTFYKHEKFDDFLRLYGISEDKIQAMIAYKPTQKFTKNGDSYTMTTSSPSGPKDTVFKSGVEFDDTIGEEKTPIKSTFVVSGNTITQSVKSGLGSATFKREFTEKDLVVSITSDKLNGVAKRFYKA